MADSVNPYEPPTAIVSEGPSMARVLALRIAAVVCALVSGLTAILFAAILASVPLRQVGFSIVYYPVFTVLFGKLAHYLWVRGGVSRPEAIAQDAAADLEIISGIVERPHIARIPDGSAGNYADLAANELLAVFRDINPDRAGERYTQLINAMRARVESSAAGSGQADQV